MKMKISPTARKTMVDAAGKVTIPNLLSVSHAEAHEKFTQQVVYNTLRELRVPKHKSIRLAAIHKGSIRERMEKIIKLEGLS